MKPSNKKFLQTLSRGLAVFFFVICLTKNTFLLADSDSEAHPDIRVDSLKELADQEIGARASLSLNHVISEKSFLACVPRESFPFPKALTPELKAKVFAKDEMRALSECNSEDCKFNFLPSEIPELERAKTADERQKLFFRFFEDRTKGLKGIDPDRGRYFIRSKDKAFEGCDGPEFQQLLNQRPIKNKPFRLSFAKYNKQMRPTLRLVQGVSFKSSDGICYGEAMIFSDHYDVDRVELWSLKVADGKSLLTFQLRHRVDLLNTWVRRLNKQKFRNESKDIVLHQMSELEACLRGTPKVDITTQSPSTQSPKPKTK